MKVTLVDGAVAALDAIGRACTAGSPFRLVLLDVQMPGFDGFELAQRIRENPTLDGTILIMLSSVDYQMETGRCRELGVHRYLVKPVFQAELLSAILEAFSAENAGLKTADLRSTLSQRSESSLRILVAEDNPVNQKVAVSVLQKRGHIVTVAPDGKRALEVLECETFDLILMDIQMPEMNGFEATFVIREKEKITGGHIPIIALTAHAMRADQERCREAGMDGYISKPIQIKELIQKVEEAASALHPA
jgi:CheY-like chemotaxis protein